MRRRDFIKGAGLAAVWPLASRSQQAKQMATIDFSTPVASGGCGAVGDGVADDGPAVTVWQNFAWNPANHPPTLTMAAHTYNIDSNPGLVQGDATGVSLGGIKDMGSVTIAAATGTKVSKLIAQYDNVIAPDIVGGPSPNAGFIQQAFAGQTSVTLVTSSDVSYFSIGTWTVITGIETNGGSQTGYPPSAQRFEYHQITNIVGSTLSLDSPLRYSYSATWPTVPLGTGHGLEPSQGGPGRVYALGACWNNTITIQNLEVVDTSNPQYPPSTRNVLLQNLKFNGANRGLFPSITQSFIAQNCTLNGPNSGTSCEIDKLIEYCELNNCTGYLTNVTGGTCYKMVIKNGSNLGVDGCALNMVIDGSTIFSFHMHSGYGRCDSLTITNSTISAADIIFAGITGVPANGSNVGTNYTYLGNGLFRCNRLWAEAPQNCIPGYCYVFAYSPGGVYYTVKDGGGQVTFCIIDIYNDDNFFYIQTDLTGPTLPQPTFQSGKSVNIYAAFPYPPGGIHQSNVTGVNVANLADAGGTVFTQAPPC
jgi:hypothetical protein